MKTKGKLMLKDLKVQSLVTSFPEARVGLLKWAKAGCNGITQNDTGACCTCNEDTIICC